MIKRFDSKERFFLQLQEGMGLFTGAGFSVLASDEDSYPFPIGSRLLDELKEKFPTIDCFPDLAKASTILEATYREEFYEFLIKKGINTLTLQTAVLFREGEEQGSFFLEGLLAMRFYQVLRQQTSGMSLKASS